jgi:transposase-like protein
MRKIRKKHGAGFKAEVALEAVRGQRTLGEIGSEYRVHALQVSKWKKQLLTEAAGIFERKGGGGEEAAELIDRLYRQIGEQKVELDWLKKKSRLVD